MKKKVLLIFVILSMLMNLSCRKGLPEEQSAYDVDTDQPVNLADDTASQPHEDSPIDKTDNSLPFRQQNYKCGTWTPLKKSEEEAWKTNKYLLYEVNNIMFGFLMCDLCESIKIVDFNDKMERIIPHSAESESCKHRKWGRSKWSRTISPFSIDYICPNDYLAIFYKNELYFIKFLSCTDDRELEYEIALVLSEDINALNKVDLTRLKWEKLYSKPFKIEVSDRELRFAILGNPDISTDCLYIAYDYYYGYSLSDISRQDAMYIAMIKQKQMLEPNIVDLQRFLFKTWEDGLNSLGEE